MTGEVRPDDRQSGYFPCHNGGFDRVSAILCSSERDRDGSALSKTPNLSILASEPGGHPANSAFYHHLGAAESAEFVHALDRDLPTHSPFSSESAFPAPEIVNVRRSPVNLSVPSSHALFKLAHYRKCRF
jgi:hypothetical protein